MCPGGRSRLPAIDPQRRNPLSLLVLLVLLSGAGLLTFAIVSLWDTVRDQDRREQEALAKQATDTALELRELFQGDWLFDVFPSPYQFEVHGGKVTKPPPSMAAPQTEWTELDDLPLPVLELLQIARQQEFKNKNQALAEKTLRRALQDKSMSDVQRSYVASVAAWQAHRMDQDERARELFRQYSKVRPGLPNAAASLLLLGLELEAAGSSLDDGLCVVLAGMASRLPEEEVALLDEKVASPRDNPKTALRRLVSDGLRSGVNAQRTARTIAAVGDRLDERLFVHDDMVVLCRSMGETSNGNGSTSRPGGEAVHGVVVPLRLFRTVIPGYLSVREAAVPNPWWMADPEGLPTRIREIMAPYLTPTGSCWETGEPVIPGLMHVPQRSAADRSFWTRPGTLIVLLVAISLCFGLGLLLSYRAMIRETQAMKSRADFLTSVTHELKTPLASIRLLAEMLDEGRVKGSQKQRDYYRLLAGESARLTVLIENVLDLGRMERGERAYDLRRAEVDGVVEEAVGVFAPLARRDGMELELDLGAKDVEVQVDCGAFVQALLNVMENARKYGKGSERLQVQSQVVDGTYQLTVRDFGPGVPEEELEAIFQRFRRGKSHGDGSIAGVGLGLYLARTILRSHSGELSCENAEDGGARFRFTLPVARNGGLS